MSHLETASVILAIFSMGAIPGVMAGFILGSRIARNAYTGAVSLRPVRAHTANPNALSGE